MSAEVPSGLHAQAAPEITTQPASQTVFAEDTAIFSVTATGSGLSYQWVHATTNLPGATSNPLMLSNVTYSQAGQLFRNGQ